MNAPRLDLIYLWHMHQQDYRDHASGVFVLPLTFLRGRFSVAEISFNQLFRRNLANLYRCLQLAPPAQLEAPISAGRADAVAVDAGGAMRRATAPTAQPT